MDNNTIDNEFKLAHFLAIAQEEPVYSRLRIKFLLWQIKRHKYIKFYERHNILTSWRNKYYQKRYF